MQAGTQAHLQVPNVEAQLLNCAYFLSEIKLQVDDDLKGITAVIQS